MYLSIYLSICLFIYLSIHLFIYSSIYLSTYLLIYVSIFSLINQSMSLIIDLPMSVCMYVCRFVRTYKFIILKSVVQPSFVSCRQSRNDFRRIGFWRFREMSTDKKVRPHSSGHTHTHTLAHNTTLGVLQLVLGSCDWCLVWFLPAFCSRRIKKTHIHHGKLWKWQTLLLKHFMHRSSSILEASSQTGHFFLRGFLEPMYLSLMQQLPDMLHSQT